MQRMTPAAFRNIAFAVMASAIAVVFFAAPHPLRSGDGLELTAVAAHLGVAHPSGYPLLTLLGYIAIHLLPVEPYTAMLLLCRAAALLSLLFVAATTRRALLAFSFDHHTATIVSAAGTLTLALSVTFREAVLSVEVYALNAMFLSAIAWLLLPRHEQPTTPGRLISAGALAGLAAANHLTSLSIAPLVVLMAVAIFKRSRNVVTPLVTALLFIILPVILYASFMLRAEQQHAILWGAPYGFENLLNHIRGGEYRSFQFLMEQPNRAFTLESYGQFFFSRAYMLTYAAGSIPFGFGMTVMISGALLIVGFLCGSGFLLKERTQHFHSAGVSVAVLMQLGFIFTYNIPDIFDYFLGLFILAAPAVMLGLCVLLRLAFRRLQFPEEKSTRAITMLAGAVALLGCGKLIEWKRNGTEEIVASWLDTISGKLPENSAVITAGDYDLYPLWYLQFAEGKRRDLFVYGGNFVRFPWFRKTLAPDDPRTAAVGFHAAPPTSLQQYIDDLQEKVIDPILPYGGVYTTFPNLMEREELAKHYRIVAVGSLIPDKDLILAQRLGLPTPPPVLYKIEPRQ